MKKIIFSLCIYSLVLFSLTAQDYMYKNTISSVSEWKKVYENEQREKKIDNCENKINKTYSIEELANYMVNMPGSFLPLAYQEFTVPGSSFGIESANINGNGIDYLVSFAGTYGRIYIYGENLSTIPTHFPDLMGFKNGITFKNTNLTLIYTGIFVSTISNYGNRIEIPVFIAK